MVHTPDGPHSSPSWDKGKGWTHALSMRRSEKFLWMRREYRFCLCKTLFCESRFKVNKHFLCSILLPEYPFQVKTNVCREHFKPKLDRVGFGKMYITDKISIHRLSLTQIISFYTEWQNVRHLRTGVYTFSVLILYKIIYSSISASLSFLQPSTGAKFLQCSSARDLCTEIVSLDGATYMSLCTRSRGKD